MVIRVSLQDICMDTTIFEPGYSPDSEEIKSGRKDDGVDESSTCRCSAERLGKDSKQKRQEGRSNCC